MFRRHRMYDIKKAFYRRFFAWFLGLRCFHGQVLIRWVALTLLCGQIESRRSEGAPLVRREEVTTYFYIFILVDTYQVEVVSKN